MARNGGGVNIEMDASCSQARKLQDIRDDQKTDLCPGGAHINNPLGPMGWRPKTCDRQNLVGWLRRLAPL